jgi:hypothetical protein
MQGYTVRRTEQINICICNMARDRRSLDLLTAAGVTESGYDVTFAAPLAVSHLELTRKSISHRRLHFSRFLLRLQGHGLQSLGRAELQQLCRECRLLLPSWNSKTEVRTYNLFHFSLRLLFAHYCHVTVTEEGIWIGSQIYWTLKQLVTTLCRSLSHTEACVLTSVTFLCFRTHVFVGWRPSHTNLLLFSLPSQDRLVIRVKVKVTLRLMVSQSVSLGVEPHLRLMTRYLAITI